LSCSSWLINHAIFPTFKAFAFKRVCDIRATFRDRFTQTGQTVIKHKDIEINIDDRMDETVINHRGMNIKLGVLKNIPSYQAEWSDVSRNVDAIAFLLFLAAYIVVYVTQILYIID
jgi:hypothetical protein